MSVFFKYQKTYHYTKLEITEKSTETKITYVAVQEERKKKERDGGNE